MKKSDKGILLMLVGIVIAAVTYFVVYTDLTEKTEVMNADNAKLRQEVERLQELADNKQQYLDDTAAMETEIENIKAQFPAQYLPEDEILYIIATEKEHDVMAQSIRMKEPQAIKVEPVKAETVESSEGAEVVDTEAPVQPEVQLFETEVTTIVKTSYTSIKDVIKKINTDKDRKSLNTLSLAFDSETGGLLGTMGFSMYSLTGTEAEYKAPQVDGVVYGTSDIFNSAQKKAEIDAAKAAAASNQE